MADITSIWVALRQVEREPETNRYPIRKDSDPALTKGLLSAIQTQVARLSLSRGLRVAVTSGSRGQSEKWKGVADAFGSAFTVRTVDPGESVVRDRLKDADGNLSPECGRAIKRWYR